MLCVCRTRREFFAALQVTSAFPHTCVEIWELRDGAYTLQTSQYLDQPLMVFTFPAGLGEDLTSVVVNSTKPVAVFSGHSCANVPQRVGYCDCMFEQIPPVSELGLTHIAPPIIGRDPDAG